MGIGDLSPISDMKNFQSRCDLSNQTGQDNALFMPHHTRHISQRSLYYETDRTHIDSMYDLTDDVYQENYNRDYPDVSYGNMADMYVNRYPMANHAPERNYHVGPSLMNPTGDSYQRRYEPSVHSFSRPNWEFGGLYSEPPLVNDDLYTYSSTNQTPLMHPEARRTHQRNYSNPAISSPSFSSNYPSYPVPGMYYGMEERQFLDMNGMYSDSSPIPDVPPKKLPYPCRDFRNGRCKRGEYCKFMHNFDSNSVDMKMVVFAWGCEV